MKKIIFGFTIFLSTSIFSQDDLENFLNNVVVDGYLNDSEIILEGFMSPLGASLGSGLNAGWFNTAKTHGLGRFDVTAGIHFIGFPDDSKSFNPSNDLSVFQINGDPNIPTFIGGESESEISYGLSQTFDAPRGTELPVLPVPYFQGSIGLIKKTELMFRASPIKTDFGKLELGYWGLGLKHDIMQWIPIAKKIPIDLSVLAAYSNLSSTFNFYEDQSMDLNVKAFTSSILLSKKLSFITLYTALGYNYSSSSLQLNGSFTNNQGELFSEGSDPIIDINFGELNGFKGNLGIRMKLLIFTIHAQYTKAEYDIFSIGLGLNADWK